jgi:hypothetical protein
MVMEVRLLTRWGSRLQGDIVSVSDARAKALEEAGFAKILGTPAPAAEPVKEEAKPDPQAQGSDLEDIKAKLDALGVSYSPRIGLEKAQAKLAEVMAGK